MRSLSWKIVILIGFMTTVVGLGADSMVDSSSKGVSCSNKPCTYYDKNDKPFPGHCGSKKGDDENCYCYKDENKNDKKKPSQTESKEDRSPCQKQPACELNQPGT
jgi:hypothetical protein